MTNNRWLARLSFVLMLTAAVLIGFAGLRSLALVRAGALGVCAVVTARASVHRHSAGHPTARTLP
jgi:hypothetical protein